MRTPLLQQVLQVQTAHIHAAKLWTELSFDLAEGNIQSPEDMRTRVAWCRKQCLSAILVTKRLVEEHGVDLGGVTDELAELQDQAVFPRHAGIGTGPDQARRFSRLHLIVSNHVDDKSFEMGV